MSLDALVVALLWLLAAYHLVMGAVALTMPSVAPRLVRGLYGATLPEGEALRYLTSMVGALALAVGIVAAVAARAPAAHRGVVAALLALQLARLACRVRDRRLLASTFGITVRANAAAALVLAAECVVLAWWLR